MSVSDAIEGAADDALKSITIDTQRVLDIDFNNSDTKTRQTGVDKRLLQLAQHMSALKSYQNSLTPTCRLPREILSHLFLAVAKSCRQDPNTAMHRTWERVARVCRYWRAVALNCRELWSMITFQKHNFTDLCLARCKGFPLTVVIRVLPYEDYSKRGQWGAKLKDVLSQTDRLQRLEVKVQQSGSTGYYGDGSRADLKTLFTYIQGVPEKLQTLVLDCSGSHWSDVLPDEVLFKGGAPRLTHMSLTKTMFNWKLPELHALTRLRVEETQPAWSGTEDKRPSVGAFCAALQRLPNLEDLELANAFSDAAKVKQPATTTLPVKLPPTLRNLRIEGPARKLKQFFAPVLIPKIAWIDLKFTDANPTYLSDVGECVDALWNSWKDEVEDLPRRDLNALSIVDVHKTSKNPRFECAFLLPPVLIPGHPHPVSYGSLLRAEFVVNVFSARDIFKAFDKNICLATAQYFTVDNTWSLPSTAYAEMLQAMPSLLVIHLRKTWMKYLLDALSSDPAFQPSQDPSIENVPKPHCPALEVLHFHLTDFNEHDEQIPQTLQTILKLFELRANGYSLKTLINTVATNFDHPDAKTVAECFKGIPGAQFMWDGSVHMRERAVEEVTDEETDEEESETDTGGEEEEESEEEEEEEDQYECTASDLGIYDDDFF